MRKILFIAFATSTLACGKIKDVYTDKSTKYNIDWTAAADSSSTSFVSVYWNSTKHHFNNDNFGTVNQFDYWPEAHGLDVLTDAYSRTKNALYKDRINEFYEGVKAKNGNSF